VVRGRAVAVDSSARPARRASGASPRRSPPARAGGRLGRVAERAMARSRNGSTGTRPRRGAVDRDAGAGVVSGAVALPLVRRRGSRNPPTWAESEAVGGGGRQAEGRLERRRARDRRGPTDRARRAPGAARPARCRRGRAVLAWAARSSVGVLPRRRVRRRCSAQDGSANPTSVGDRGDSGGRTLRRGIRRRERGRRRPWGPRSRAAPTAARRRRRLAPVLPALSANPGRGPDAPSPAAPRARTASARTPRSRGGRRDAR
jgi:hypothetical protein